MKHEIFDHMHKQLTPSKEAIESLEKAIQRPVKRHSRAFRTITALAACMALILSATILPGMLAGKDRDGSITEGDKALEGFFITVYAAEDESPLSPGYAETMRMKVLSPGVETLLPSYDPTTSAVPGFPFQFRAADAEGETLRIEASGGAVENWDKETGEVLSIDIAQPITDGEAFYWSPISDGQATDSATLTLTCYRGEEAIGHTEITITRREDRYYATIGAYTPL